MAAPARGRGAATVSLVLCALTACAAAAPEINSAIIMTSYDDWGPKSSRCLDMVDRAAQIEQTRLVFVPTLYFVDTGWHDHSQGDLQSHVSWWCYAKRDGGCPPATWDQVSEFREGMTRCFKRAVDKGLSIVVVPHVDDGQYSGLWRNGLVFDPLVKYGELSYADFMLHPLADALNAVVNGWTRVWMATQGEMGATVMYYPDSHRQLLASLKERVWRGKPGTLTAHVKTGVLTNADKLCNCMADEGTDPSYSAQFARKFSNVASQFNLPAIRALFEAADFVGFSNYPTLPSPDVQPADLERGVDSFATELAAFGVDLRRLLRERKTQLFFSEIGVGGGADDYGTSRTSDPKLAATKTFYGVTKPYRHDNDPWHADGDSPMLSFLKSFYSAVVAYAAGACRDCRYAVNGVFLWNCGSWDVQGIHPSSFASDGSYQEPTVIDMIARHNADVARKNRGVRVVADDGAASKTQAGLAAAASPGGPAGQSAANRTGKPLPALAASAVPPPTAASVTTATANAVLSARPAAVLQRGGAAMPTPAPTTAATAHSGPRAAVSKKPNEHFALPDFAVSLQDALQDAVLAAVDRLGLPGGGLRRWRESEDTD